MHLPPTIIFCNVFLSRGPNAHPRSWSSCPEFLINFLFGWHESRGNKSTTTFPFPLFCFRFFRCVRFRKISQELRPRRCRSGDPCISTCRFLTSRVWLQRRSHIDFANGRMELVWVPILSPFWSYLCLSHRSLVRFVENSREEMPFLNFVNPLFRPWGFPDDSFDETSRGEGERGKEHKMFSSFEAGLRRFRTVLIGLFLNRNN